MDTKVVLALGGGLAIGTIIGFGVGYYISGAEIEDKYLGEVEFLNDELRKYRDLLKDYESKDPVQEKKTTIPQDATKSKEPSKREMDTRKTDYTKYNKPYEYQSTPIDIPDSPPEDEPEEDPEEELDDITKFIRSGKTIHPSAMDKITRERMESKIQADDYLRKQQAQDVQQGK